MSQVLFSISSSMWEKVLKINVCRKRIAIHLEMDLTIFVSWEENMQCSKVHVSGPHTVCNPCSHTIQEKDLTLKRWQWTILFSLAVNGKFLTLDKLLLGSLSLRHFSLKRRLWPKGCTPRLQSVNTHIWMSRCWTISLLHPASFVFSGCLFSAPD